MRKAELLAAIKTRASLNAYQADEALAAAIDHIVNALARGEEVALLGFGSFRVTERKAREGRHPQTGEPMSISASRSVSFRPGKALKDTLNGGLD